MRYFLGISRLGLLSLLSLALVITSITGIFVGNNKAHATSAYDGAYTNTTVLTSARFGESDQNVSNIWLSQVTSACSSGDVSGLNTAMSDGSYAVVQVNGGNWSTKWYYVTYTAPLTIGTASVGDSVQGFSSLGLWDTNTVQHRLLMYYDDGSSPIACHDEDQTTIRPMGTPSGNYQPFVFGGTWNFTYPSGYAGTQPPVLAPPKPDFWPQVKYTVSDLQLKVVYTGDPCVQPPDTSQNHDGRCAPFKLLYEFQASGDTTAQQPQTLNYGDTYDVTLPSNGSYTFSVAYASLNQTPYANLPDEWNYVPTIVHIEAGTGSQTSGDTKTGCTLNAGNYFDCADVSAHTDETCDLFHLGGCVDNIIYYLKKGLGLNQTPANPTGSPFVSQTTNTHGLTAIITAPLTIIRNVSTESYTCSPLTLPLPNGIGNLNLPCMQPIYASNLGAFYLMYQTIVTGIISYYVIANLLRMVKGFKDPKSDKIEMLEL